MKQASRTASTRSWRARRPHATTEKQIEKRLRELRNVKRGKPARKPTKKRQQRNRTNKLASAAQPRQEAGDHRRRAVHDCRRCAPANKEAALEAKKRLARDASKRSCLDLDSGATCWGLVPDRTAWVPCTLSVVASPPTARLAFFERRQQGPAGRALGRPQRGRRAGLGWAGSSD